MRIGAVISAQIVNK